MARRNPLFLKWEKMKLSAHLTGVKKFYLRSIERLKLHILEKKGMSVLVGSFVWKDQVPRLASTSTTTTSISPPTYSTESYIVVITDAAQTELDTLSAGEIITKQFKTDHPHVKKLHKRTDNAGNFSSHSTLEVEKVICERVSNFLNYLTFIVSCSVARY